MFSMNVGIDKLNKIFLIERMNFIREDLMKAVYHPNRLEYYLSIDYDMDED